MDGSGNKPAIARQLLDMPYHALFDQTHPGSGHDLAFPALILALGEPKIALERIKLNANNEPNDVLDVIWELQFDPICCDKVFQEVVDQLKVTDRRAERVPAGSD